MWLKEILWIDKFVSKIKEKHNVTVEEVEDALLSGALFRRARRGRSKEKMFMSRMAKPMQDVIFLWCSSINHL